MIKVLYKTNCNEDIINDVLVGNKYKINSKTHKKRENPEIIDTSRKRRIAKGAGKDIAEMNAFMKQFESMRAMMRQFNKFKGKGGGGLPGMNLPGMDMFGKR